MRHVRMAALLAGVVCVLAMSGCGPKPTLVGRWEAQATSGKRASLSTLTLESDGTFRYAGKNALGGPVAFGGTYKLARTPSGPTLTLVYADFPNTPVTWYYALSRDELRVSTVLGDLKNGTALTFQRQR